MASLSQLGRMGALGIIIGISNPAVAASGQPDAVATPPGITLVDVTSGTEEFLWRRLGDVEGKALYTFDGDAVGQSSCRADCAKEFPPYIAREPATSFGDWTLIPRDGGRQWAYRGQALYYYSGEDPANKKKLGRQSAEENPALMDPGSELFSPKQGWKRAAFLIPQIPMPPDVMLKSVATANGYAFAVPRTGMLMYVLGTPPKNHYAWTPVYAPNLGKPIGDFSIVVREDGKRQWAYKEQPLYTSTEDYSPNDVNGLLAQNDAQVALAVRHFTPPGLKIDVLPLRGPILVTAKGMSVYTQTRYQVQYGGRETRDGFRYNYAEAKAVGTRGCEGACLKQWIPVRAPANAQSSGFWEVMARSDGAKQWAYKGAALYMYSGDKKPGDDLGDNRHDVVYGDPEGKVDLSVTGGDQLGAIGSGFYWRLVSFFN